VPKLHCDPKIAEGRSDDEKFVMVIPPSNVTGSLHLGHALTAAVCGRYINDDGIECWVMLRCMFLVSTPFLFCLHCFGMELIYRRYI
jgi:hypothetical protein